MFTKGEAVVLAERLAKFCDVNAPGWASRIDLETLDTFDYKLQVLGQLYGDYAKGRAAFGLTLPEAEAHGFGIPHQGTYDDTEAAYKLHTEAVKVEIRKRLAE